MIGHILFVTFSVFSLSAPSFVLLIVGIRVTGRYQRDRRFNSFSHLAMLIYEKYRGRKCNASETRTAKPLWYYGNSSHRVI